MTPDVPTPQTTRIVGQPYGTPPPCIHCHQPIDPARPYLALLDGPARRGSELLAVAHPVRWDDAVGDYDHRCADALRLDWLRILTALDVGVIRYQDGPDGPQYYAGADLLHPGDLIDVLTGDGTWLGGRFRPDKHAPPGQPAVELELGGWTEPACQLELIRDVVVRRQEAAGQQDRRRS